MSEPEKKYELDLSAGKVRQIQEFIVSDAREETDGSVVLVDPEGNELRLPAAPSKKIVYNPEFRDVKAFIGKKIRLTKEKNSPSITGLPERAL